MKRFGLVFFAMLLPAVSCLAGNHIPKSKDFGKYDEKFHQVFNDVAMMGTSELHSLMVIKDGKKIYENYSTGHDKDELHILWSASKTFTSLAIGFARQDGLLALDDKVLSFFPDVAPENPSEYLQQMTVKDLLMMASGFSKDYLNGIHSKSVKEGVKAILASPVVYQPGSKFKYNSSNTYLLSAIITKVTGKTTEDYLEDKLFNPLKIRKHIWEKSEEGLSCGGWGLFLQTESLAKTGLFMLQEGRWNGRQLLDSEWIHEASSFKIVNYDKNSLDQEGKSNQTNSDWSQGYAYQIWICTHNAYRMAGANCQFVIVIPDKNAVIVTTSQGSDGQGFLNSIWKNIYPCL